MTITEKQNNYILSIIDRNKDAEEYFDEYMRKTRDDPESRDLSKLLQDLIRIKDASDRNSQAISEQNVSKLNELCLKTPQFMRDVETYLARRNVRTLSELRQYDAMQLKLFYIDSYLKGVK